MFTSGILNHFHPNQTKCINIHSKCFQIIFNPSPTLTIHLFHTNCLLRSQPPIPTSNDTPSTNDMFTLLEHLPQSSPLPSSNSVIQPPSASNIQDTKKISKVRAKTKKRNTEKNEGHSV
ncbi:hypothetical protein TNCV_53991 [Trichonephila clavipes]|nr:hypothetical protein TNCV_53991 [Trichonephila clavipes]